MIILNHSLSTFAKLRQAFLRLRSGPSDSSFPVELATILETDLIVSEASTAFPGTASQNEQYFNESYKCPGSNQNGGIKRKEKKRTWSSVHTIESETRSQLQSIFFAKAALCYRPLNMHSMTLGAERGAPLLSFAVPSGFVAFCRAEFSTWAFSKLGGGRLGAPSRGVWAVGRRAPSPGC